MFANFTEETCTGTGNTLALAGATAFKIPFSESFADGDLVAYVVEDSGGTIKVAGVGTYVSATDDITRNDTWNWNGTAIDESPSTNITLSGGTHTVRCDVVDQSFQAGYPTLIADSRDFKCGSCRAYSSVYSGLVSDRLHYWQFQHYGKVDYTQIGTEIENAAASSNVRIGIYSSDVDGTPKDLIVDSGDIDSSTTGEKTASQSFTLKSGLYWGAFLASDNAGRVYCGDSASFGNIDGRNTTAHFSQSYTFGALPSTFAITSPTLNASRQPYVFIR